VWHPGDGVLYASLNGGSSAPILTTLDASTGLATNVGTVPLDNLLGLSVAGDQLIGFAREGITF